MCLVTVDCFAAPSRLREQVGRCTQPSGGSVPLLIPSPAVGTMLYLGALSKYFVPFLADELGQSNSKSDLDSYFFPALIAWSKEVHV